MPTAKPQKIFFENLDALRFICFLMVFLFHSFHTQIPAISNHAVYQFVTHTLFGNGNLGVNFFFVLSGFLITYLLLEEKRLNGRVNIRYFYVRRILRIWPLYFACVFFGFVIFPYLKSLLGQVPNETANPWAYLFFVSNFDLIKSGLPDASMLGVLWSVAIEEQFYLFWPLFIGLVPTKRLPVLFGVILVLSLVFRALFPQPLYLEYHTLSCIGDMTIGAIGAYAVLLLAGFKQYIANLSKRNWLALYLLVVFIVLFRHLGYNYPLWLPFERVAVACVFLLVILEQNYAQHSLFKLKRFKCISHLGKISYGLYCLHFLGILIMLQISNLLQINQYLWGVLLVETIIALFLTIIVSEISFHYLEKPFLALKKRFAYFVKASH